MRTNTVQTPIFLFSLPRSGSTLVQRILAAHDDIATMSEPWVLLPHIYALRERGAYAEYNHSVMSMALEDFCRELPNSLDDYLVEVRNFAMRLYGKAAGKEVKYFLDKTPRYHLIVEDIMDVFPDGKFVFLWRNPLSVVASIMETWGAAGKWNLHASKVDLFEGVKNLTAAYEKYAERAHSVRYEDLIANPEEEGRQLFAYLDLPFELELLHGFARTQLRGRMGDPTGVDQYQVISKESLEKWKNTLANPIRKAWCRRYIRWIGRERLMLMGYDMDSLLDSLSRLPLVANNTCSDLARILYGLTYTWGENGLFLDKIKELPKPRSVYAHR
jgi:hypothetical protein